MRATTKATDTPINFLGFILEKELLLSFDQTNVCSAFVATYYYSSIADMFVQMYRLSWA